MVIKSKTWKTRKFRNLLDYLLKEEGRDSDFDFIITHNVKGETPEHWERQFQENEDLRLKKRSNSVILTHYIISFSPESKKHLTSHKLKNLTEKFIEERGVNGMYVATPHMDQEHIHIHICASGVGYKTGTTMRQSKKEFASLKRRVQEYQKQKYPELHNSIVEHGKSKKERTMNRKQIIALLRSFFTENGELINEDRFKRLGAEIYLRGGKPYGITYKEKNYRFNSLGVETIKLMRKEKLNKLQTIRDRQKRDLER